MKILFIFLLSLSLQTAFAQSQQEIDHDEIIQTEVAIQILSAQDMSCKKTSDCDILPLGHRACGGAKLYFVTSKLNASYDEVAFLAERSIKLERAYNRNYSVISICSLANSPTVKCVKRLCKTMTH